jgi:hypothetical protein
MPKYLRIANVSDIDKRTQAIRYEHPIIRHWVTTQCWTWDGGDAMVVMVGAGAESTVYVAIRVGDEVQVVRAEGVNQAMRAVGLDPSTFTTTNASWEAPSCS